MGAINHIHMDYAVRVDRGKKRRREGKRNEDSVSSLVFDERHRDRQRDTAGLFVLADGAGGHEAGDVASYVATTLVPRELSELLFRLVHHDTAPFDGLDVGDKALLEQPTEDEIREEIQSAVDASVETLANLVPGDVSSRESPSTTLVVGLYARGYLHLAWVGDSCAYVVNESEGSIEKLTRDHSPVTDWVDDGEFSEPVGRVHPKNSMLSRAVSPTAPSTPEYRRIPVYGDDIVLFTSDGLIDAYDQDQQLYADYRRADDESDVEDEILDKIVTDGEIRDCVLEARTLEVAAERLVGLANERGGSDNISTIVFQDPTRAKRATAGDPTRSRSYGNLEDAPNQTDTDVDTLVIDSE